jgi:hypothetical protein
MPPKPTPTTIETGAGVGISLSNFSLLLVSSKIKDEIMTDKKITDWGKATYVIKNEGQEPFEITVSGRDRWALEMLMRLGQTGCTPITKPAPRWSAYVFNVRGLGVNIITITEPHAGPFKGTHGRYVLQSIVTPKVAA